MKRECAVRRGAMQIDGRTEHRDLSQDDGDNQTQNKETSHALVTLSQNGPPTGPLFYPRLRSNSLMKFSSASTPASGKAL